MCASARSATLISMTNNNGSRRRRLVCAAVAVFGAGVIGRELIRSGTVAEGLLTHWYGHAGVTAIVFVTAGTGMYLLHRAYRR
jgi:hypothetical protein